MCMYLPSDLQETCLIQIVLRRVDSVVNECTRRVTHCASLHKARPLILLLHYSLLQTRRTVEPIKIELLVVVIVLCCLLGLTSKTFCCPSLDEKVSKSKRED
jgi:ABC-type uncharacterized transport system permease subunit